MKQKAQGYRRQSVAESTKRNRDVQWKSYTDACKIYGWREFPCGVEQACSYVTYLAERLTYQSVLTYYCAVVFMHVCNGFEPVRCCNPILKATLEGIARVKGKNNNRKDPLFHSHLKRIASVVDTKVGWEVLLFTCMLFLFRTLLRVSHVVRSAHTLLQSDVKFNHNGFLVAVRSSKTLKKGDTVQYLPVVWSDDRDICAVTWLKRFLKLFPKTNVGPLFALDGKPPSYSRFLSEFKKLLAKAGVEGNFATHSLRRGGATFMSMSGCTIAEVKERGRWKSDCVYRYISQPLSHTLAVEEKVVKSYR